MGKQESIQFKDRNEKGNVCASYATSHGGGEKRADVRSFYRPHHCAIATAREVGKKGSLHKEGYRHKAGLE